MASPPSAEAVDAAASTRYLARRAGIHDGLRVLDAGCGVGGPALAIAAAYDVVIDGVTVSPVQVELGRELVAAAGLEGRVRLHLADYHALPFPAATFDVALVFEATCYSHDKPELAAELGRVLRPGGTLYIKDVFANEGPLTAQQQRDLDEFHDIWGCVASATIAETVNAVQGAGLEVVASGPLPHVSTDHFYGSMIEVDPVAGVRRNRVGEHFLQQADDIPLVWGEVRARKPLVP